MTVDEAIVFRAKVAQEIEKYLSCHLCGGRMPLFHPPGGPVFVCEFSPTCEGVIGIREVFDVYMMQVNRARIMVRRMDMLIRDHLTVRGKIREASLVEFNPGVRKIIHNWRGEN